MDVDASRSMYGMASEAPKVHLLMTQAVVVAIQSLRER